MEATKKMGIKPPDEVKNDMNWAEYVLRHPSPVSYAHLLSGSTPTNTGLPQGHQALATEAFWVLD